MSKPDVTVKPQTLAETLMLDSEFGGTDIERIMDGAAHRLGYVFDYAQYYVPLTINGSYTTIDRVLMRPRTAVYCDGPQHAIREAADPQDALQKIDLESQGWLVVRLDWKEIYRDPIGCARSVLYAQ